MKHKSEHPEETVKRSVPRNSHFDQGNHPRVNQRSDGWHDFQLSGVHCHELEVTSSSYIRIRRLPRHPLLDPQRFLSPQSDGDLVRHWRPSMGAFPPLRALAFGAVVLWCSTSSMPVPTRGPVDPQL